jgi:hypothetical protein
MNKVFWLLLIFMVAAPLFRTGFAVAADDDRSTSREVRQWETEQMLKNDLNSFQQSDDHGALLFSFVIPSRHTDLSIRSVTGDESSVLHGRMPPLDEIKDNASKNKENDVP